MCPPASKQLLTTTRSNASTTPASTPTTMSTTKSTEEHNDHSNQVPTNFILVGTDEPHYSRRKEIEKKYPQIKQLYGPDIRLFPVMIGIVLAQLSLCYLCTQTQYIGRFGYWLNAWFFGGFLTSWLSLGNHELSHNLCFKTTVFNETLGMIANLAQGLPSCITFKRYHLEHHYRQGEDGTDMDVPTEREGQFFNTPLRKILWVILQPAFYALRPVLVAPKQPNHKEIINYIVTISFDLVLGYYWGWRAPVFNIMSTLLGMGLHPVAGHFISEHYVFTPGQETYSYYGPLNYVTFNVGYHNEHHDFPMISGFRLPRVKAMAPEYYNTLASYKSWTMVIYNYITRPDISPYSRVKRFPKNKRKKQQDTTEKTKSDAAEAVALTTSAAKVTIRSSSSGSLTTKEMEHYLESPTTSFDDDDKSEESVDSPRTGSPPSSPTATSVSTKKNN